MASRSTAKHIEKGIEDQKCKSLEATIKDWKKLECHFNKAEDFNPNNFWTDHKYEPNKSFANQASRGGISFVKESDKKGITKCEAVTYISNKNFLAKAYNKDLNKGDNLTCKHGSSKNSDGYPRWHSEIAFIQYLTELEDPANMGNYNFLNKFTEIKGDIKQIIILIRNSSLPPCFWDSSTGIDVKIKCLKYLTTFSSKLHEMTQKPVTCIVFYAQSTFDFTRYNYSDYVEELKRNFTNVKVDIENINSKIIISVDKKQN